MSREVQQAYDLIDAYKRALALAEKAKREVNLVPEHRAEDDASGAPLDDISDLTAGLQERIDLLSQWLAVHDREEAYP